MVEESIIKIFHHALESGDTSAKKPKDEIEKELRKMTHGHKVRNFFPWKLYFADVFTEKSGFDVVIANPPYLGEKGNKDIFRPILNGKLGQYRHGKMDIFYYFFHLSLNIGKANSQHAFISTNYYITATGGKKLRLDLKNRATIRNLLNLNELKIFESALGQHEV